MARRCDDEVRNANRSRLEQLIRSNPGIHKSRLRRLSGLAWGTVDHHVRRLVREGRVACRRSGSQACLAAAEDAGHATFTPALLMPASARILRFLADRPMASQAMVCRALGLSRDTVRRHLQAMAGERLVATDGGYHPRYWLAKPAPVTVTDASAPASATAAVAEVLAVKT